MKNDIEVWLLAQTERLRLRKELTVEVGERVGEGEPQSLLVGWQVGGATMQITENSWEAKNESTVWLRCGPLGARPRDLTSFSTDACSASFAAVHSPVPGNGNNLNVLQLQLVDNKKALHTVVHMSSRNTQWYQELGREVEGTRKYYTQWGNPDPERQATHVLSHLWFLATNLQTWVHDLVWPSKAEKQKGPWGGGGAAPEPSRLAGGGDRREEQGKWEGV